MKIIVLLLLSFSINASNQILIFDKSDQIVTVKEGKEILNKLHFVYGKREGKKQRQGDLKTPEGTYKVLTKYSRKWLKKYSNYKEYGSGALVLNYPNRIDIKNQATGGGIWIHGTDYPKRLKSKNITRGCLVLENNDISYLMKIIKQGAKVIIKP